LLQIEYLAHQVFKRSRMTPIKWIWSTDRTETRNRRSLSQNGGASFRPLGPYLLLRFDQIFRPNLRLASETAIVPVCVLDGSDRARLALSTQN
jgi:hypothetical protein